MKISHHSQRWLWSLTVAVIFTTNLCLAAPGAITNNFNTAADVTGWGLNFGTGTIGWDAYSGPDGSGCLKIVLSAASTANHEVGPLADPLATPFSSADYVTVEYDMMIDPNSGFDANGTYGNWQEILRDASWSWESHWVGALYGNYNVWTHMKFAVPNNAKNYPRLGFALQGTAPYSADVTVYIDNLVISPFVNPLIVGSFKDDTEIPNWGTGGRASLSFSTKDAAGSPSSGSLKADLAYDSSNTGWQEGLATYNISFSPPRYTYLAFDLFIENPNSLTSFGIVNLFLNTGGWTSVGTVNVNANMVGTWTHIELPLPSSVTSASGLVFQFGGGMTAPLTYYLDNVKLYKPVTPPTIGLKKAGSAGVQITMNDNGSQWQRDAIVTPSGAGPLFWSLQSFPVTYSYTITNFPDAAKHPGFEAHMYLINGDTDSNTGYNQTYGGADWNVADIFEFRVENSPGGGVICRIDWKTNLPNANPPGDVLYHPVIVNGPTAIGTWNLTFTDNTHATVTGPGITATNFTLPDDAVSLNFSPFSSYIQFGFFKNDGANDGHNNQASGTFSRVQFTGTAYSFDDSFNGATLTNNYVWRVTTPSAVTYVPPGTAWWVDWTLPADGFSVESAPTLLGPWANASVTNTYQSGAVMYGAVPGAALPGTNGFFRLSRPK
jgi:hypothetical protein